MQEAPPNWEESAGYRLAVCATRETNDFPDFDWKATCTELGRDDCKPPS